MKEILLQQNPNSAYYNNYRKRTYNISLQCVTYITPKSISNGMSQPLTRAKSNACPLKQTPAAAIIDIRIHQSYEQQSGCQSNPFKVKLEYFFKRSSHC